MTFNTQSELKKLAHQLVESPRSLDFIQAQTFAQAAVSWLGVIASQVKEIERLQNSIRGLRLDGGSPVDVMGRRLA